MRDLFDVWRCQHGTEWDFTFSSSPHTSYSRIDFFHTDKCTLQKVGSSYKGDITWLDHAPIGIRLSSSPVCKSNRVWRLNPILVNDPSHKFFKFNDLPDTDRFALWGAYKTYMRGVLIKLTAAANKKRMARIDNLYKY